MSEYLTETVTVYVWETQEVAASLRLAEAMLTRISQGGSYDSILYLANLRSIRAGMAAANELESEVLAKLAARKGGL